MKDRGFLFFTLRIIYFKRIESTSFKKLNTRTRAKHSHLTHAIFFLINKNKMLVSHATIFIASKLDIGKITSKIMCIFYEISD